MTRIGLLVGREKSFPDALIAEVTRRGNGASCEYVRVEATRADRPLPYDVIVDRISHDVPCYQPVLKVAALNGTYVINDPFWRIADDKFYDVALALRLGVRVPRTFALPSKAYNPDVNHESLRRNMALVDWDALAAELGFPMFLKPHWGGGWKSVTRVATMDELWAAYDASGLQTMIVQEAIPWVQYVRCIVVGKEHVRPALWDPRLGHFERYTRAAGTMAALSPEVEARIVDDARKLCSGLKYDMNTVEFAVTTEGEAYAIDFMNSAPDLDVTSLGQEHFDWAVARMADLVVAARLGALSETR